MNISVYNNLKQRLLSFFFRLNGGKKMPTIAWTFCGALFPAVLMSVYYFGLPAIKIILTCVAVSLILDAGMKAIMRRPITMLDGKAFLIGLLLALCLPSRVPLFIPVIGACAAIVVAKHRSGHRGHVLFHPTLFGLAVLLLIFPAIMTTYSAPAVMAMEVDAKTTETPLALMQQDGMGRVLEVYQTKAALYVDLFLGNRPGALGETSVVALLLGAAFLLIKRTITWYIPVFFIATVGVLTWIFGGRAGLMTGDPIFHMMSGGLVLGAFFIATDAQTSPRARIDQVLFGIACGALTVLFRIKGPYSEGVMLAILIMNCATPLFDRGIRGTGLTKNSPQQIK